MRRVKYDQLRVNAFDAYAVPCVACGDHRVTQCSDPDDPTRRPVCFLLTTTITKTGTQLELVLNFVQNNNDKNSGFFRPQNEN